MLVEDNLAVQVSLKDALEGSVAVESNILVGAIFRVILPIDSRPFLQDQ